MNAPLVLETAIQAQVSKSFNGKAEKASVFCCKSMQQAGCSTSCRLGQIANRVDNTKKLGFFCVRLKEVQPALWCRRKSMTGKLFFGMLFYAIANLKTDSFTGFRSSVDKRDAKQDVVEGHD